ncbi:MAG: hypothetical protein CMJ48_08685 [Planctomycetaceae bacterium]|nr:hypothetical protein [Planctomycetaceae bacterium]
MLAGIEDRWQREQTSYRVQGAGPAHIPSRLGTVVAGTLSVALGVPSVIIGLCTSGPFPWCAAVCMLYTLLHSMYAFQVALEYKLAQRRYQLRRTAFFDACSRFTRPGAFSCPARF